MTFKARAVLSWAVGVRTESAAETADRAVHLSRYLLTSIKLEAIATVLRVACVCMYASLCMK